MRKTLLLIIFSLFVLHASSQEPKHEHHHYHLGFGTGASYLFSEETFVPGFHIHAMHNLGHNEKFSIGLGFETLLNNSAHYSVNFLGGFMPFEGLIIETGPGLSFSKHDNNSEYQISYHLECIYEFEFKHFHAGPMLGLGIDPEELHATLGVHVGIGL